MGCVWLGDSFVIKSPSPKKRQVVKTGDVVAIPLPDGQFAFGLQIGECTAIYAKLADSCETPPIGYRKFLFAAGIYTDVLSSTEWPKVGKEKLSLEEVAFASLGYVYDDYLDIYKLYNPSKTDEITPSSKGECFGLEPVAAWDKEQIIERIFSSFKGEKSEWLDPDPWVPFGLDMSVPGNFKRVPVDEVLA